MYKDWEDKDKTMQVEILCELFNSYKIFIKDVKQQNNILSGDKSTYIKCINNFLNKVLNILKILESDWKKTLSTYTFKNIEYNEASHKNMTKYFKSIFWENIYIEIIVKKKYKICNYLINDYLNLINQDLVNCTELENFKTVESLDDIYDLQNIMVSINSQIDNEYSYDFLFNQVTVVNNFQTLFNRLESLSY